MRLPSSVLAPLLAVTCLATACRDEQAGPRQQTPRIPAPTQLRTLDAAPADLTFRSGATFAGGAVVYLGSKVSPEKATPGTQVRLAHYFQAVRPPPQGFAFFVHVVDPASGGMLTNADHEVQGAPLRWRHGRWARSSRMSTRCPCRARPRA